MAQYNGRCKVVGTGVSPDNSIMVRLDDRGGAFSGRWFGVIDPEKKRFALATALAAIAQGRVVWAETSGSEEYSELKTLYMFDEPV